MKKVLYVIIGLVVIYLILCLVGPKDATVTRSINITASTDVVKAKMADLKFFQEQWSPWSERDPQMKVTYLGEMGQPGYGYSWTGNDEVGTGTLQITGISGDSLLQKLTFEGMGDSKTYFVVNGTEAGTNVTWGIQMDFSFMTRAMMLFMNMDKMMGADFESGLSKLKKAIESLPAAPTTANYEVKEIDWTAKTFVGKRTTLKFEAMKEFFANNYSKIFETLGKAKIEPNMAPSAIYWKWDQEKGEADFAAVAGVPVGTKANGWESFDIIPSKVLHIAYYGAYEKSIDAHMAMDAYMKEKNIPMQSYVIEEYVTDPMTEKDTAKWLTNIYYVLPGTK